MVRTGYIYKLAIKDGSIEDCYIGSTSCIKQRKRQHKCRCNNKEDFGYNIYVYQFIRENGGFNNWDLYILEKFEYETKLEKEQKERKYIELLKPKLNRNVPSRTCKEWHQEHPESAEKSRLKRKDIKKLECKEYYQKNRADILQKSKEHRAEKETCDICGLTMNRSSVKRHIERKHS